MHESWKPVLQAEFEQPYFKELSDFLHAAYESKTIYPPKQQVFSAFTTDLNNVKVIIIGQDPYHGPGQAHGLAFSVRDGIQQPPSLQNIFKEKHTLISDLWGACGYVRMGAGRALSREQVSCSGGICGSRSTVCRCLPAFGGIPEEKKGSFRGVNISAKSKNIGYKAGYALLLTCKPEKDYYLL